MAMKPKMMRRNRRGNNWAFTAGVLEACRWVVPPEHAGSLKLQPDVDQRRGVRSRSGGGSFKVCMKARRASGSSAVRSTFSVCVRRKAESLMRPTARLRGDQRRARRRVLAGFEDVGDGVRHQRIAGQFAVRTGHVISVRPLQPGADDGDRAIAVRRDR